MHRFYEKWFDCDLPYSGAFVTCPFSSSPNEEKVLKVSVSTVKNSIEKIEDSIPVVDLRNREKVGDLCVCIGPLHSNYNRTVSLVEFIEFYKLLGASKMVFYNISADATVNKVLNYYSDSGIADVLPWNLPLKSGIVSFILK